MHVADKEVGDILEFIRDSLAKIKHQGEGLSRFAKNAGLIEKNVTDCLGYNRHNNPTIRTTYKILRGILGRPPISLNGGIDYLTVPLVAGRIAAHPAGEIAGDAVESLVRVSKKDIGGRPRLGGGARGGHTRR